MKLVPNMFLLNVSDISRAKMFYESIFDIEAAFDSPNFVSYPIAPGVMLALQTDWDTPPAGFRPNTELVMNVNADAAETDRVFAEWVAKGATEVEPPHMKPFGYTFVVADPDGNMIRMAPEDN